MSRQSLQNECDRENYENRKVDIIRTQRMDEFWKYSNGNFFITGDGGIKREIADKRRKMLLSAIKYAPSFSKGNLVVIHNDDTLEQEVIREAYSLERELIVISEKYPNYHLFYRMNREKILSFFDEMGKKCGYPNMIEADSYARAFMEILEYSYPVSLPAMIALADKSDKEIYEIARDHGVTARVLQDFERAVNRNGGDTFRGILNRVHSAMARITRYDCDTKFNMMTATRPGEPARVILINMNISDTYIFNLYMKYELDEIRGRQVSLIVDDIPVINESGFMDSLKAIAINKYSAVGLCAGDIFNMIQMEDLRGFNTHCIFEHANNQSLTALLNSYGTYHHAYVQETQVIPAGRLITFIPQRTYTKAFDVRPRIRIQDMEFAVLKGHRQERCIIVSELL